MKYIHHQKWIFIGKLYHIFQLRIEQPLSAILLIKKIPDSGFASATDHQDAFWTSVYNHNKFFVYVCARNNIVQMSLGKALRGTEGTENYQMFPTQC